MKAFLTPDDLKKGDLVPPGWYPVEIIDYDEAPASDNAKNPGSTNCTFFFKVIDGEQKGATFKRLFNETALGFGKTLWKVFFGDPDPVKGYTMDQLNSDTFKQQIGKKLKVYVKRGKSDRGNEFNDVQDFMPLS